MKDSLVWFAGTSRYVDRNSYLSFLSLLPPDVIRYNDYSVELCGVQVGTLHAVAVQEAFSFGIFLPASPQTTRPLPSHIAQGRTRPNNLI